MIRNLARGQQSFTSNVFLVTGDRSVLVDVGNDFDVLAELEATGEFLDAVVLTHTHPDHVGNLAAVRAAMDVPVFAHDGSRDDVDESLADGETVHIGDHDYVALHTPGHRNDHLCLYSDAAGVLFAGDLVFANGGFGRTDLEEGDRATLIDSIEYVLETVDEDLEALYAGHGPSVTTNPYQSIELASRAAKM